MTGFQHIKNRSKESSLLVILSVLEKVFSVPLSVLISTMQKRKIWRFFPKCFAEQNVRQPKREKSITSTVSKCRFRIWHAIIYFYSTNDICYLLFLRQETGTHFLKMLAGHVVFSSLPPFRFNGLELKSQHLKTKCGLEMVICKYEFIIPLWQP